MISRQNDYSLTSRVYPGDYSISEFLTRDNTSYDTILPYFSSILTQFFHIFSATPRTALVSASLAVPWHILAVPCARMWMLQVYQCVQNARPHTPSMKTKLHALVSRIQVFKLFYLHLFIELFCKDCSSYYNTLQFSCKCKHIVLFECDSYSNCCCSIIYNSLSLLQYCWNKKKVS